MIKIVDRSHKCFGESNSKKKIGLEKKHIYSKDGSSVDIPSTPAREKEEMLEMSHRLRACVRACVLA